MKTVGSSLEAKGHFQRPLFAWLLRVFWLSAALSQPCRGASFLPTGSMTVGRFDHTATLLPSGKVLVAGGNANGLVTNSAELFDPATGLWSATGPMNIGRSLHTATLLMNGKVLVAGSAKPAELYDPATGVWTTTGSTTNTHNSHTATFLANGKLLVA